MPGLDDPTLFGSNRLIFTVCDEHGRPVGFASRALEYDALKSDFDEAARNALGLTEDQLLAPEGQAKLAEWLKTSAGQESWEKVRRGPKKYVNSTIEGIRRFNSSEVQVQNRIYQKDRRLFGFHQAKKHAPPLYIFEGYPDVVTAYNAGLRNACAIGSTKVYQASPGIASRGGYQVGGFCFGCRPGRAGRDREVC